MLELSKAEKIKFIEDSGIQYFETPEVNLDGLYKASLVKDLIKGHNEKDCFGKQSDEDSECKKCWLSENGSCKFLKDYFDLCKKIPTDEDTILIEVKGETGVKIAMENINTYLNALNTKPTSLNYKIAQIILESDNTSFGEVIAKILAVCGDDNSKISYVKTRFYQVRKLLQEQSGLNIEILTQKYLHISKKEPECQS